MSKGYEERTIGERRYEKTTLSRGPCRLVDGKTIEVTSGNVVAWKVWKWGYEWPLIQSGLQWMLVGYMLEDPNPPEEDEESAKIEASGASPVSLPRAKVLATGLLPKLWPVALFSGVAATMAVLDWLL